MWVLHKIGDGGVDLSPIADLLKSEVFKIGKELGIISSILNAKPTDGLWVTTELTKNKLEQHMQN